MQHLARLQRETIDWKLLICATKCSSSGSSPQTSAGSLSCSSDPRSMQPPIMQPTVPIILVTMTRSGSLDSRQTSEKASEAPPSHLRHRGRDRAPGRPTVSTLPPRQ